MKKMYVFIALMLITSLSLAACTSSGVSVIPTRTLPLPGDQVYPEGVAYDPTSDSWSIMPSMPVSRHGLAAGAIGNRLILVGGDVQSSGTGVDVSTSEVDALILPGGDR